MEAEVLTRRLQTSMAVFNEMEGRRSKEEDSEARRGLYFCGEHSCKTILAVNFLYTAHKSIR